MTLRLSILLGCFATLAIYSNIGVAQEAVPYSVSNEKMDPTGEKEKDMTKKPKVKKVNRGYSQVAVLDLQSTEDNADLARALTAVLSAQISMIDGYKAISRNDLHALLSQMETAQVLGCDDVKCAVNIAKAAKADLVVYGSIEEIDGAHTFSLTLTEPQTPQVLSRQNVVWRSEAAGMVDLVAPYTQKLFLGEAANTLKGDLDLIVLEGAAVFLNGKELGETPLSGPIRDLPIGQHVLEISKEGYVTHKGDVVVGSAQTTALRIELIDKASLKKLWQRWDFWTYVGVGTAAIAGSGIYLACGVYDACSEPAPPPTTLTFEAAVPVQND